MKVRPITITAASDSKEYDGDELSNDNWELTAGTLADNDHIESVTVTGFQTEVGSSANVPSGAVIMHTPESGAGVGVRGDGDSYNVTNNYNISYVDGTLTVLPNNDPGTGALTDAWAEESTFYITAGETAILHVITESTTEDLTYSWTYGLETIPDANTDTYYAQKKGNYYCTINDAYGNEAQVAFYVTVNPAWQPII